MKNLVIALSFLVAMPAFAADWTPVFRHLEVGKKGDGGAILDKIMENTFKDGAGDESHKNHKKILQQPLTEATKTGKYSHVPTPYRMDMLPAKVFKNRNGVFLEAEIPLKNATLYGQPIQSLSYYYGCTNCGDVGFYVTFKPMSNSNYQKLRSSVRFKIIDEDDCYGGEPVAQINKNQGQVYLSLSIGC